MKVRFITILLVAIFAVTLFGASTAMAEPREKVLVCHYDDEYDYWKLIDISGNAVEKHFANHDDALPGGVTSQTGTTLNNSCEPTLPSCGDCLENNGTPGCSNAECEATVCAIDGFCCDVSWDGICADEALDLCAGIICEG
jgi:hypothetical protein